MQRFIPRPKLVARVLQGLRESLAVALLGARQVGKTTLARLVARQAGPVTFFDLERPSGRAPLEASPEITLSSVAGREGLVVLDEVQRIPSLLEILRPL